MTKPCTKCKIMKSCLEFYTDKRASDGLYSQCKKCVAKHKKEMHIFLKRETIEAFGSRCVHVNENGIQCPKNVKDNLKDLQLTHPNGDGDEHRKLISSGYGSPGFYRALKRRSWNTDGYVVKVMCSSHHHSLDNSGNKHFAYRKYGKLSHLYKKGKFNDPDWLKKEYETKSAREIAKECGVCYLTILNRMIEFGHPRRKRGQRP